MTSASISSVTNKPWPVMTLAEAHAALTAPGQRFEMEEVVIRGVPTRVWKNAPPTLREVVAFSRLYQNREVIVHENERVTFEGFYRAVMTLAHAMQKMGVEKGDRVAIIMRNVPEWPVIFYAAEIIGAIVTPLNAWWTGPELEYGLVDSGAEFAFTDAERLERIAEHFVNCPDLEARHRQPVGRRDAEPHRVAPRRHHRRAERLGETARASHAGCRHRGGR